MLLGIGIDILSIARLEGMIARRGAVRLAMRICSQRELVDFHALREKFDSEQLPGRQLRFLCARWASKEAAFKALPPRTLSGWKDVELSYARSGRPELRLVWESRERLRARRAAREAAGAERSSSVAGSTTSPASTTGATISPARAGPARGDAKAWGENTTDVNTDLDDTPSADIALLATLSHDAGVLVAAVVAQRV